MKKRAQPSGIVLTEDDAAIAKGMLARGDRQHDVAAWFGVNGGRIAEISTGHRFAAIDPAPSHTLLGPYPAGRVATAAVAALSAAKATATTSAPSGQDSLS